MTIDVAMITCWYKDISMSNYSSNLVSGMESHSLLNVTIITSHCHCLPRYSGSKEIMQDSNYKLVNMPSFSHMHPKNKITRSLYSGVKFFLQLLRGMLYLSKCKPSDVIHYQQSSPFSFGIFPLIPIMFIPTPTKKIITIHSFYRPLRSSFLKILYNKADKIIVHSRNLRQFLLSMGVDASKIQQFYHGVNIPEVLSRKRDKIVFFGSPTKDKGAVVILEALKILKARGEKTTVYFYGIYSTFEKNLLDVKAKELGVTDCIVWGGRLTEDEFDEKMQESLFTFAVYTVPVSGSNIVTRAMANATPIIASRIGGLPEYIQNCGVLIEPNNPEALANAIFKLKKNPTLRTKLGNLAREQAKQFSWKFIATENLKIYLDVLKERK